MNVIIANERKEDLEKLGIEVIKSMDGVFSVDELLTAFRNFYFNKMIIDFTAIKDSMNISNLQRLVMEIDANKIILLLPNTPECSSKSFLLRIISIGIYNFTNNIEGVKYLVDHTNTENDVSYVYNMQDDSGESSFGGGSGPINGAAGTSCKIIGFKNITDHAGSTTLIYMIKKELERHYGESVYAIEVSRHDLEYFNVKNTISTNKVGLTSTINKIAGASFILVDLNDMEDVSMCDRVIYLIEPSSIMLNKLMRADREIFDHLTGSTIVLNKSMLSSKEVSEFEYETKAHVFFNMPPVNDRRKSDDIVNFLTRLGMFGGEEKTGGFFSLFRN